MRLARILCALAAVAVTALTALASTALAQEEPIEASREGSVHCSTASQNCNHHIEGSSSLILHAFGSESVVSQCNDEFIARLSESGNGSIISYMNNAASSSSCTRIMCDDAGQESWPITNIGEYTGAQADEGHVTIRFCFDDESNPGGTGTQCTAEVDIENHGNHKYGYKAISEECPILNMDVWVELNGAWESEGIPGVNQHDIEYVH